MPYSKVWSALTYGQLLSSVGNKICGKIQCRAVGTFASLLAPLLLPPVPPNTGKALRTLFFFFPSKILCGVSLSIFSGIHVLYKRFYHVGAQDGIIVHFGLRRCFLQQNVLRNISVEISLF